ILRASMKGVLPQDTRKRIKQPFYSPIKEWFFSPQSPEFASSLLSHRALQDSGLFDPTVVTHLRNMLNHAPINSLMRHQLEWILILVLGSQALHQRFVKEVGTLTQLGTSNSDAAVAI
ncbi:MAG: hypothetical protein IT291_09460, partial [Deltaproteobacteria bacterium]|nr:hypothetical protein [Deltaproteobacteria bacterium]